MTATVLVIAGLDPSGGAGLVADVMTVRAAGCHAAAVATALTVQDSARCHAVEPVDPTLLDRQLEAVIDDLALAAVKIGMLGDAAIVRVVAARLRPLAARGVPIVLDPVLRASSGASLFGGEAEAGLLPLLAIATLLTPNRDEAEALTGLSVEDDDGQRRAARALRALGPRAVLVKGGHVGEDGSMVVDLLDDGGPDSPLALRAPRIPGEGARGTGCALASGIAARLAIGHDLRRAIDDSRAALTARLAAAWSPGRGRPFLEPA